MRHLENEWNLYSVSLCLVSLLDNIEERQPRDDKLPWYDPEESKEYIRTMRQEIKLNETLIKQQAPALEKQLKELKLDFIKAQKEYDKTKMFRIFANSHIHRKLGDNLLCFIGTFYEEDKFCPNLSQYFATIEDSKKDAK